MEKAAIKPNQRASGRRGAIAVNAVKSDHQSMARVKIPRGPKRSPAHPPGIWHSAYPQTNELRIQPIA